MTDRSPPTDRAAAPGPHFHEVLDRRLGRRGALKLIGGVAASAAALPWLRVGDAFASGAGFKEVARRLDERHHVAEGYESQILLRWGDAVLAGAPAFDPSALAAAAQARQFGYNNDFLAFLPLPYGSGSSTHGLLVASHEYTNAELMWAGIEEGRKGLEKVTKTQVEVEMAAHGLSVVELRKDGGAWRVVAGAYNRRVTAGATTFRISGPAAGHARLRTRQDPTGTRVVGTINNCSGGKTPWGTILSGEENFNFYFGGPVPAAEAENYRSLRLDRPSYYAWHRFDDRFDMGKEPNEPNRFGWVVELDPYAPGSLPIKRTALGRFKHEGAACVVNDDGRLVVYSGDDEADQFIYKFVSRARVDPSNRAANANVLDDGTLYVARLNDDGTIEWLPLVHGTGPLIAANGFHSQADILIETRRAAALLKPTRMDRPEDIEAHPKTGHVFAALTNNRARKPEGVDKANPRANNKYGHIVEMIPPRTTAGALDHAAPNGRWDIFLLAGDPAVEAHGAKYHPGVSANGWLAAPDNLAFDPGGRMWIATDQGALQRDTQIPDGLYACDTDGAEKALTRLFFACPLGAELCGPEFTPDGKTLFVAVQHPAEGKGSTFAKPSTAWPDFTPGVPPRPSVLAITKRDGGAIGS
ncbi:MAG: PhoX family phosphatase [Alphaproteobacteria bacterium]